MFHQAAAHLEAWRAHPPARPEALPAGDAAPRPAGTEILIGDTTLCDGELAPGVAFGRTEKLRIAERLAAIGVPLIEAGFPAASADEVAAVRGIVEAELGAAIQAIARPLKHDIDMAVHSGAHRIALCIGTSDAHVKRKLRTDRPQLLQQIRDAVGYARRSGRQIVFTAEDATRTAPEFLISALGAAEEAGADAVGLADSAGVATPHSIAELVRQVADSCRLPITVYCHNDLGLATANAVAALGAGATGAQCSVLGLGGRAGITCLEELVLALEVGYGVRTGLDLRGLAPLARQVAALAGQSITPGRPVVGRNAFLHESGLRTSGVVREPGIYEPYPPELIGRSRGFAVGKDSGRSGIGHILARYGLELANPQLDALLGEVGRRECRGEPLREDELLRMAQDLVKSANLNSNAHPSSHLSPNPTTHPTTLPNTHPTTASTTVSATTSTTTPLPGNLPTTLPADRTVLPARAEPAAGRVVARVPDRVVELAADRTTDRTAYRALHSESRWST